ncbi:MAG: hypothetical protein IAE95_07230 [Chitinophagaceae bacterium]|nr:hypothetical protein [Chitinophagaceae bacterium]
MKLIPLLAILALVSITSTAKTPSLKWPITSSTPTRPALDYGSNGRGLHYFTSFEGGYSTGSSTSPTDTAEGSGFFFTVELGARFEIKTTETRYNLFSLSLAYTQAPMSKYKLEFVSLPISYISIGTGRNGTFGTYWQAGAALRYTLGANMGNRDVKAGFNTFLADPFLSVGISGPFRLLNKRHGDEIGGGRYLLGPCFSYSAMNMVKNGDMHGYMLGLRYQLFFM